METALFQCEITVLSALKPDIKFKLSRIKKPKNNSVLRLILLYNATLSASVLSVFSHATPQVLASHVSVSCKLFVLRLAEVEHLDYSDRTKVKYLFNCL